MVSQEKVSIPVRIKFSKTNELMYISHLDLARTMQRIILRAGIDIWYSEGFNPQPKMVFALPLPTGAESVCELLDIKLNSYMDPEEIKARLNANFPSEMRVISVYTPNEKIKEIAFCEYEIDLYSPKINYQTSMQIDKLFSAECLITKKTKSGEKEINICDYIGKITTQGEENHVKITAILCADNEKNLSPELVVLAIRKSLSIMETDSTDEYYTVMRKRLLKKDFQEFS